MNAEKLVRMANEIARNLAHMTGDDPVEATAQHLVAFWTPGMRATLAAHAAEGGAGLDTTALAAALRVGAMPAVASESDAHLERS